jgi:cobalt transporter subunit CbtB
MTIQTQAARSSLTISQRLAAGISVLVFGSILVFGVGLAHADRLHNAAHDTRHAIGFPCH